METVDFILERILLKRGIVLPKQMDICKADESDRPLSIRLIEKKLVSREQLEKFQKEAKELAPYARNGEIKGPMKIGEILIESKILTPTQVHAALRKQNQKLESGQTVLLGEILVKNGYVTESQLRLALKQQGKTVMTCTGCGSSLNIMGVQWGDAPKCHSCGALLQEQTESLHIHETKIRIQTAEQEQVPDHIREAAVNPLVQFGKYIIVKEITKAPFGTIFHGWQKDKKKEVGIIFLEKKETQSSSATFIKAQRELLSQGYPNPGLLEVGEYDGRNYMSMSLED